MSCLASITMCAMAHSPPSALSRFNMKYWTLSATVLEALALCAGSTAAFAGMVTFVLTWAVLGAFYSDQQIWQIAMQVRFLCQPDNCIQHNGRVCARCLCPVHSGCLWPQGDSLESVARP